MKLIQLPNQDEQAELKKASITVFNKDQTVKKENQYLALRVEIGFPLDAEIPVYDFDIVHTNKRGYQVICSNFRELKRTKEQNLLVFDTYLAVPNDIQLPDFSKLPRAHYGYVDLCWSMGNGTYDPNAVPPVDTEAMESSKYLDLNWVMPSRFVDVVAEGLAIISRVLLASMIQEAIIYGPFVKPKDSENLQIVGEIC